MLFPYGPFPPAFIDGGELSGKGDGAGERRPQAPRPRPVVGGARGGPAPQRAGAGSGPPTPPGEAWGQVCKRPAPHLGQRRGGARLGGAVRDPLRSSEGAGRQRRADGRPGRKPRTAGGRRAGPEGTRRARPGLLGVPGFLGGCALRQSPSLSVRRGGVPSKPRHTGQRARHVWPAGTCSAPRPGKMRLPSPTGGNSEAETRERVGGWFRAYAWIPC